MKHILLFILILLSLGSYSQTTYVIKPGDSLVILIPATITVVPKKAVQPPRNIPPTANAGSNQTITLPVNSVNLSGTAIDQDGNVVSNVWTKSTTLTSTIVSPNALSTSVTGMERTFLN
jgi:hypothetical protein